MIKYLGKDQKPFLLSYTAFKEYEVLQSKAKEVEMYELFAYCGFKSGHKKEGKEFIAEPEDMEDWFDEDLELFGEVLQEVSEALPQYKEIQKKTMMTFAKIRGEMILEEAKQEKPKSQKPQPGKKSKK